MRDRLKHSVFADQSALPHRNMICIQRIRYLLVELWVKAVDAVLCVFCDDLQFAVSCVTVTRVRLLPVIR